MQFLAKVGKLTFLIGIFMLIGNVTGQLGIFPANWEKIWYRKPDPVLYREKALTAKLICAFVFAYAGCRFSHEAAQSF